MNKTFFLVLFILVLVVMAGVYLANKKPKTASFPVKQPTSNNMPPVKSNSTPSQQESSNKQTFADPVTDFKSRVTKKPFGIYITPQDSPIDPERFTGYHTGADAEYQDVSTDVPVLALADGDVVLSKTAIGYGGVFMLSFNLNNQIHTALYGHIRPDSLPRVGQKVKKGEQIGVLGTGYSQETDGERRHLHFGILSDNRQDIKGYVQQKTQLSGWIDPLSLYQ